MATVEKTSKWFFDLEENLLTKEVTNDYTAKVKTLMSKDIPALAREIVAERTEFRYDTVVNIANLLDEKIRAAVATGNTVVTGSALYAPMIQGAFIGTDGVFDPTKNKCTVNITPSEAMRAELAKVIPEFSGNVKDAGGARIGLVTDSATKRTDGFMTPGKNITITGKKIRCLNADGSDIGIVRFVNTETDAEAAVIDDLTVNDPSKIILTVPGTLAEGTYRLEIETYYSTTSTLLKNARTLSYAPLYVGEVPTSGGDDDDEERPGGL